MSLATPEVLTVLERVPEGLFSTPAERLATVLPGPSLLRLEGQRSPALFFSVLLHGNETSGWDALCQLMQSKQPLERDIVLFIGNVSAAAQGVRTLPGQLDFNRLWRGEHQNRALVDAVLRELAAQPLFAAVDFHNNTGRNPHYTVLTQVTPTSLALASLFSDKAVLVEEPDTVLTRAVQDLCPATTVEVGPISDPASTERARQLMEAYLTLTEIPTTPETRVRLHRALARIHVREQVEFAFADGDAADVLHDLTLTGGMEAVNFHPLPAGTEFGVARRPLHEVLTVVDPAHRDVTPQFLEIRDGHISLKRPVIPAMYTTDSLVIRQDCLCYLMEELA